MDVVRPWSQKSDEPNRWYRRFSAFRLLGPGRKIIDVYQAEFAARGKTCGRASRHWYDAANRWQWVTRAEAWDKFLIDQAQAEFEAAWRKKIMGDVEVLGRLSEHGRADIGRFFKISDRWTQNPLPTEEILGDRKVEKTVFEETVEVTEYHVRKVVLDLDALVDPERSWLVREFTDSPKNGLGIKLHDTQGALVNIMKHLGLLTEKFDGRMDVVQMTLEEWRRQRNERRSQAVEALALLKDEESDA